jgi:hypothetical protein
MKKMFFLLLFMLQNFTMALVNGMQAGDLDLEMGIVEESKPLLQKNADNHENYCKFNSIVVKNTAFKPPLPSDIVPAAPVLSDIFPDEVLAHIFSYIPARTKWLNHIIRGRGFKPINCKGEVTPFFNILQNMYETHTNYLIQKSQNNACNHGGRPDLYSAQNTLILHEMINFMNTKKYKVYHSIEHDNEEVEIIFPEWADREMVFATLLPQQWDKPHAQNIPELVPDDLKNALENYYENTKNEHSRLSALHTDDKNKSQMYSSLKTAILEDYAHCVEAYPNDAYFYGPCCVSHCVSLILCSACSSASGAAFYFQAPNIVQISSFVFSGIFFFTFCLGLMQFMLNGQKIMEDKRRVDAIQNSLNLLKGYKDKISLLNLEESLD